MANTPEEPTGNEPWRKYLKKPSKPEIPQPGDKAPIKRIIDKILRMGPRRQPPITDPEAQTPQAAAPAPQRKQAKGGGGSKAKTPQSEAAQGAASPQARPNFISSEELERLRQEAQALLEKRLLEEKRRKMLGLDNDENPLPKKPEDERGMF